MNDNELRGPITAEMAEAEPEQVRLFGPSYDARQCPKAAQRSATILDRTTYQPWKKPRMTRVKG